MKSKSIVEKNKFMKIKKKDIRAKMDLTISVKKSEPLRSCHCGCECGQTCEIHE